MTPKLLLVALVLSGSGSGLGAPDRKAVDFDWTQFGRKLRAAMPKDIKAASTLRQVHYLAEQTGDQLWALGIAPNYDQTGRDRAKKQFGDSTLGTCGHTATCLLRTCLGAGIPEVSLKTAVVVKRGRDGMLVPDDLNADHAVMVFMTPEGGIVFDLWCDGRAQKTFANFRGSIWKGMPVGEWARRMHQEGYTGGSCEEHPELGEVGPLELAQLFRKIAAK
jgi:hypothetical protein